MKFGPVDVAAGEERTQCIQKRLTNADILRAHQIHNVLNGGSHHLIVYRTNDTVEKPEPFDCQPFLDTLDPSKGSPIAITQKHDELITLPDGVAFTLQPNQMVRMEVHYLNASAEPTTIEATTTFLPIAEPDFKFEADFMFLGNPDIDIPANSTFTLGPSFLPIGKLMPDVVEGAQFFGITGHTHQWGTNVTVETAADSADPGTSVYDVPGWQWSEPETVYADPPFQVPQSGGFKLTCEWKNLSAQNVGFGESANDEMCFFWAYYYPSKGSYVCAHTDQYSDPLTGDPYVDICCPGSPLCVYLDNFLNNN